nr:integrase, catalytic region, zinc finger, CCHC-type, peptidase aspartic, catalytic [Tanacetum cinerariifolium]
MPFIDMFRNRVYDFAKILKKEVKEFEHIFDDLAAEYDQGVKKVKCLEVTNRNLVRKIDCLISDNIASEVSDLVLTADNLPLETQENPSCVKEIAKCLELEAEIELKFQKYRDCFEHPSVCDNTQSLEYNAFFEINKLKEQLQGKDNTIKQLQTQLLTAQAVQVGPNVGDSATQTLETEITQLKDNTTSLNIQLNAYKIEISALTSENATLKAGNKGKPLSPSEQPEKLKVLAPGISAKRVSIPTKHVWRTRGKVETSVRQEWKPTGRTLSLYDSYPLTRIAETEEMHLAQTPCISTSDTVAVPSRFVNVPITCLEVAFRQHSCHIRNKDMVELIQGSRSTILYSISLNNLMAASPVCLLSKASSTKSWLGEDLKFKNLTPSSPPPFFAAANNNGIHDATSDHTIETLKELRESTNG